MQLQKSVFFDAHDLTNAVMEELMKRRAFFKRACSGILPFIGIVPLTNLLYSCDDPDDDGYSGGSGSGGNGGCGGCSTVCTNGCGASCASKCRAAAMTIPSGCNHSCKNACYSCRSLCYGSSK